MSASTAVSKKAELAPNVDPDKWLSAHGDFLFNYALMHLRDNSLAEELVQDTFVSALRSAGTFKGLSSERTWLAAILKHKIIDHLRKMSRQRKHFGNLDGDAEVDAAFDEHGHWSSSAGPKEWLENPLSALEQKGFFEKLNACISTLPEKQRIVFMLREIDELSTEEICNALGLSSTNLWVLLHRARLRLRKCLEINWFRTQA